MNKSFVAGIFYIDWKIMKITRFYFDLGFSKYDRKAKFSGNVRCFWFGLVSLFNGIAIFMGYFILKPSVLKNSSDTI